MNANGTIQGHANSHASRQADRQANRRAKPNRFASAALTLTLLISTAAQAQAQATAQAQAQTAPTQDHSCVVAQADRCALRCVRREVELQVLAGGEITVVMHGIDRADPAGNAQSISVQQDLQTQVQAGSVNPADANLVVQELSKTDGALYTVPNFDQLKADLGFPQTQEFAAGDWPDLLRADLQRVLGVGIVTASYLASRIETHSTDNVALESSTIPNRN